MAPEPGYATAKVSRETLRVVAGSTISEASGCMATCMALDNRDILPPFLPVGRNEDGVFGRALGCLIPGARLGHIPWAVLHSPPEARRYDPEAIRRFSFGLGELFVLLLGTHDPGPSRLDARTRIARAGAYFVELGGMPVEDLFAFLRRRCLAALEPYVAGLEAALQGYGREPAEWADDVEGHLSATMQAATEPAFCVPADLAGGGTVEERSAAFRRLVGSYGSLLEWWPSIVGAARQAMERRDRLLAAL